MGAPAQQEIRGILERWLRTNERIFLKEMAKRNIGVSTELRRSLRSTLIERADGFFEARLEFLKRGRFVDMGAGRKPQYSTGRGGKYGKRKKKQWYSRPWYGRLNDLQGVVQMQYNEEILKTFRRELHNIQ